ncbi:hypothetical protein MKW92_002207 [Papaver armeniacum]|nr:hypothetical protein MKW92_002207 [Papaver armeniacum]
MEPIMLFSLFFVPFIVFLSSLYFIFSTSKTRSQQKSTVDPSEYPPGKTGWPIVGETFQFGNLEKFIQERMNKYSKHFFKTSLFCESFAVLCGPDGNKFLFSNEDKLVISWFPRSIHKMFPVSSKMWHEEKGKTMRKILSGFHMPGARQRCISIMDRVVVQHLITNWDNKKKVTVSPLAKNYTLCVTCNLFLGIDDVAGIEEIRGPLEHLRNGIISLPIDLPGTAYYLGLKALKLLRNKIMLIIKQRKIDLEESKASAPTQDVLSKMILEVDGDGNPLDELFIANKMVALFLSSGDTSGTLITFIIKYLAELPGVYNEVQEEMMEIESSKSTGELLNWDDIQKMKYSWNVACEVMRLIPPSHGSFREAITDFNYKGFSVPKGWKLFWSPYSTHKNSDYFPEPEKFDPTRFEGKGPAPYTYVPFGGGPHVCPGQDIAKLLTLVFMYHVVRRYEWDVILPDEKIVSQPYPRPVNGLPILLRPKIVKSKE